MKGFLVDRRMIYRTNTSIQVKFIHDNIRNIS